MKWKPISEIPKQKNRMILFVEWHKFFNGKVIVVQEYVADDYQDALNFRTYEMKNSFTHWAYVTAPKDLVADINPLKKT